MAKNILMAFFVIWSIHLSAQTTGKLDVTVTTSSTGGNYAPRHILAIWIEDDSGNFVKTLLAYADRRITHLNEWEKSTDQKDIKYNRTDAITGATKSSHDTRTCSWDGTDYNKVLVTDGKYFVCMELTDKNASGNYSKYEFEKGDNNSLTPLNVPSFSSISISWMKSGTVDVNEIEIMENVRVFPNPANNVFFIRGENISEIEVLNLSGKVIFKNSGISKIDMSKYKNGIYLARIKTNSGIIVKKLVKE